MGKKTASHYRKSNQADRSNQDVNSFATAWVDDKFEDSDWSHECGGYFTFYDPLVVDDSAMDTIAEDLRHGGWARATYKELVKSASQYSRCRDIAALALISFGGERGVAARITTTTVSHAGD